MPNNDDQGYNEITLSIALLGGIVVVILKVIDYSNNQSLDTDFLTKPVLYGLMIFLLVELLIIFLFFIFRGISVFENDTNKKQYFKDIAGKLFKASFIIAFMWIIASILTVSFKLIYTPKQTDWIVFVLYLGILLISGAITVKFILKFEIKILDGIIEKIKNFKCISKFYLF